MLDLHQIKLSPGDIAQVKLHFEKNGGYLKYKDCLHQININKDVMDPLTSNWLFIKPNNISSTVRVAGGVGSDT